MFISISQLKDHSISVDHTRYDISVSEQYLETATIEQNLKFHKTTSPHDMIFTIENDSTSEEQVGVFSRYYNIHYRACVESLIYILSTRVYLCFSVH